MGPTAMLTPCAKTTLPEAAAQCPWDTRGDAKVGPHLGHVHSSQAQLEASLGPDRASPHLPQSAQHWGRTNSAISGPLNFSPIPLTSCHTRVSPNKVPS